jgi:hypothetical protein
MADPTRWIQDALDSWLSPEQGTGPEGDEGWRERTGYLHSPIQAAGGPSAPAGSKAPPASDWIAERYEEQRSTLRTAMTAFMSRMMYFFPDRNAMTIDDLAAAAGLIAEQERQVHLAGAWAVLHRLKGRPDLGREADAALAELAQLKQVYALQRRAIEQREARRIQEINRNTAEFVRAQEANRRELARRTDDYEAELRRKTEEEQGRLRDKQHRDFLAYIRGERIYEIREL